MTIQSCLPYVLLFGCLAPGCKAHRSSEVKVLNGKRDLASHTASVGLLIMQSSGVVDICTGTVVTATVVMTAAHCLEDTVEDQKSVRVVDVKGFLFNEAVHASAKSWKAHPKYPAADANDRSTDLAFVTFAKPGAIYGASIARLAPTPAAAGDRVTMVGYGNSRWAEDPRGAKASDDTTDFEAGIEVDDDRAERSIADTTVATVGEAPQYEVRIETAWGDKVKGNSMHGDSGGGVYNSRDEVISVDVAGVAPTAAHSTQVGISINVHSPVTAAFIKEVVPDFVAALP